MAFKDIFKDENEYNEKTIIGFEIHVFEVRSSFFKTPIRKFSDSDSFGEPPQKKETIISF